jgi:LysM repeat protein
MNEVYERFDREFTLVVYNHAQVYLWLKRMERYFPAIEDRLRYFNLPDDLKWVAIVESDLVPNVCSPKGAAGPWQFMPSTGSAYGLSQKGSVDKRYDFECSTDSAFLYLNDLYKKYRSWSLAIAAYNCGEGRILNESRSQGVRDYYHMKLPQETERYVFRILAVKAVLSNPTQYGYNLPKGWGYQELQLDRVRISLPRPTSAQTLAASAGITYREFKQLNPIFRSDDIPAGNQEIKLPAGRGKVLEQSFKSAGIQPASNQPAPQTTNTQTAGLRPAPPLQEEEPTVASASDEVPAPPKVQPKSQAAPEPPKAQPKAQAHAKNYVVKSGDTLSAIARKHDVSVEELKKANKLKSSDLTPGQKLQIP